MKKILVALIVVMGCMSFTHGQTTDFRGLRWGDSLDTVQATEKSQFLLKVNDDELVYKDILGGSDCNVYYIFNDNDKLASGMYVLLKLYNNTKLYIQDYYNFKKLLTKKYRKPIS